MYKVNDVVLYSTHGICRIDDITEKVMGDEPKQYYVMHPLQDPRLTITIPVKLNQNNFKQLLTVDEAEQVLASFKKNQAITVDKNFYRSDAYSNMIQDGDRFGMVQIIQSILAMKTQCVADNKKLPINYVKVLDFLQKQLFTEISFALDRSTDEIERTAYDNISVSLQHA